MADARRLDQMISRIMRALVDIAARRTTPTWRARWASACRRASSSYST
jgi:hypothetical protein